MADNKDVRKQATILLRRRCVRHFNRCTVTCHTVLAHRPSHHVLLPVTDNDDITTTMDFDLLSSCRFDPALRKADWNSAVNSGSPSPYLLLPYVVERFIRAAQLHKWSIPKELTLNQLQYLCDEAVQVDFDQPQKVIFAITLRPGMVALYFLLVFTFVADPYTFVSIWRNKNLGLSCSTCIAQSARCSCDQSVDRRSFIA